MRKNRLILLTVLLVALLGACMQHTIDPTQTNDRTVRIETVKPTGTPAKNVEVSLFEDQSPGAALDFAGNTGDSGAVSFRLSIPTFGHSYALLIRKSDPFGGLLFSRPIYPLTLTCADTLIRIVVPESDTSATRDSLCGSDDARTLTFYACADTSVTQTYILRNCSNVAYTVTSSALSSPFSITPTTANVAAGGVATFALTYDGRGQTSDASSQVTISTSNNSGKSVLTLIGHLLHDCPGRTQAIICGLNSTSDSVRFGTVCQGELTGPRCVSFVNTNAYAATISFPKAPTPFSYSVTKNGVAVNTSGQLTLQQGESMSVCLSILAASTGAASATLVFPMQCQGNASTFTFTVPLSAQVTVCNTCNCSLYFHDPVTLADNVRVGTDTTFTTEIFHNTLNCPVTVLNLTSDPTTAWSVLSTTPALPTTVAPGGSLSATVRFAPVKAGLSTDPVKFTVQPSSGSAPCTGQTDLNGTGCNSVCATVTMPASYHASAVGNLQDSMFLLLSGNPVPVSTANKTNTSDESCIILFYPDTGCGAKQIRIVPPRNPLFGVTTLPSPLILSHGETGTICVQFTAPLIEDVRKTFPKAGMELKYIDSLTVIDPGGCTKFVPLKAVVDTLPGCDQFTLTTYDATSATVVQPFYEVWYYIGHAVRNPYRTPPNGLGLPPSGDLYTTNNASPVLSIVAGGVGTGRGLYVWTTAPTTDICGVGSKQIVTTAAETLLKTLPPGSFTQTVPITMPEVILVELGGGLYSVLSVNSIDTPGNTRDGISAVNFQLLYPIFGP